MPIPLDLVHATDPQPGLVAAYLVLDGAPSLVDCGAAAQLGSLEAELARHGLAIGDLRRLLLTHIHLDHAGAAGALVARNPDLEVHVHAFGVRHLVDPARLIASTRSVYGQDFERVWGEIAPVPSDRIRVIDGDTRIGDAIVAFPTPGHCRHHVAYLTPDGTCYAGVAAGAAATGAPTYVEPPTPPPDVDVDAWRATITAIARRRPARLAISHFGVFEAVESHLDALRETLERWVERYPRGERAFVASLLSDRAAVGPAPAAVWGPAEDASWHYAGLARWMERS